MSLELLFLGTGTSAGVPMIGCRCEVCRSTDPRDRRSRPSVLVRYNDSRPRQILIDTTPDLRQQMIQDDIDRLDAVLFTHCHADHIFGLDDLRRFNAVMKAPIDIYAEQSVLDRLGDIFSYIFNRRTNTDPSFVAKLNPTPIRISEPITLYGAQWTPIRLLHGRLPITGWRVDNGQHSIAYCTDVSSIPPESYPLLANLDLLVLDALRYRHHPTHFTVDQALQQIEQLKPKRAYLTHIAHDIRHADLEKELPDGVYLPFDGLRVSLGRHQDHSPKTP